MLLIVKNENWFLNVARRPFNRACLQLIKEALSLCRWLIARVYGEPSPRFTTSIIKAKHQFVVLSMITTELTCSHRRPFEVHFNNRFQRRGLLLSSELQRVNSRVSTSELWARCSQCCFSFIPLPPHTRQQPLSLCRCRWKLGNQCTQTGMRGTWFWITQGVFACIIH